MTSTDRFQHTVNALLNYAPRTSAVSPDEKIAVASITF